MVINPTEEEIDEQIVKMEARRARVKAEKKKAKAAKKGIASTHSGSSGLTSAVSANDGFKRPGIPGNIQVSISFSVSLKLLGVECDIIKSIAIVELIFYHSSRQTSQYYFSRRSVLINR